MLLVALFIGYMVSWALLHRDQIPSGEASLPFGEKLRRASGLVPVMLLIDGLLGATRTSCMIAFILRVAQAAIPFFCLLVALAIITVFSRIVTLLPNMMGAYPEFR